MPEGPTPLYVRLATDAARRLDEVVAASGLTKRQIVEDAVRQHLGDEQRGFAVGRVTLREQAPDVLTAGEAAGLLRLSEEQVQRAAEAGELPGRRIAGEWRFAREPLLAWLAAA